MTLEEWAVIAVEGVLLGIPITTVQLKQTSSGQAIAAVELASSWRDHLPPNPVGGSGSLIAEEGREAWFYLAPEVPGILGVVVILVQTTEKGEA